MTDKIKKQEIRITRSTTNKIVSLIGDLHYGVNYYEAIKLGDKVNKILEKFNQAFKKKYKVDHGIFKVDEK